MASISLKQLEAAFRYKIRYKTAPSCPLEGGFNIKYEGKGGVFEQARKRILPSYLTRFPDDEEGHLQMAEAVIKSIDEKKTDLERYFKPASQSSTSGESKPTPEVSQSQVSQATAAGGLPFGMPAATTSAPAVPRRVFVVQQTPPPSSGMEGGSGQGTAATAKGDILRRQEVGAATAKGEKIRPFATNPGLKFQSNLGNTFKNFGSRLGVFFQRNAGKYLTMGRIAAGVSGVIGGITGGALTGGQPMGVFGGAGLGAAAPSWITSGGGGKFLRNIGNKSIDAFGKISNQISAGKSNLKTSLTSKKKFAWIGLGILFLFILLGGIGGTSGAPTSGTTSSTGTSSGSLDYSISFRDTGIQVTNPEAIKTEVRNQWPNAQLQSWDTIVTQSIANGWNPAFVLALWIEETGAQGEASYTDPLGCDPNHPTTDINVSLKCLFGSFPASEYPNGKFEDFMCMYSESRKSPCVFNTNPNFPGNIKSWYSKLVPSGSGALTPVSQVPPPPAGGDYRDWMAQELGIKMNDGFTPDAYKWAYDILYQTTSVAPKFKGLIHQQCSLIILDPTKGISHTESCTIPLSFDSGENFFKFLIIHELGHKINTTAQRYNNAIISARTADASEDTQEHNGFLSYYSEHAASDPNTICGEGDNMGNRADEEFADSVAYYINSQTKEQNMKIGECGKKWPDNPFNEGKRYKQHYELMTQILK